MRILDISLSGDRLPLVAAAIGFTSALVMSLFVHALLLLAAESVAFGGTYAYSMLRRRYAGKKDGEVVDAEFKEVN